MRKLLATFSVFTLLIAIPASADSGNISLPTLPPCEGDYAIIRTSAITQGGSMDGFMKAVEAHLAWYRSHGFTNNTIYVNKILSQDLETKTWKYSEKEAMVVHVRPPQGVTPDAAWDAYVKQYRDNSSISSELFACVPKSP